uniref:Serpentine Receptor, class Z n=1 Tax=Caenorhabditis tropicalis TaxID=1561998 RepID=A0A1I7THB0_9PELO
MSSSFSNANFFLGYKDRPITLDKAITLSAVSLFLLSYLIFPFYNHIFKMNQKRDEATPIFQIINHFHRMIQRFYFIGVLFSILVIIDVVSSYKVIVFWYYFIAGSFIGMALIIVTEVNNFLLGLLAIQRFLLYFVPSSDKYLNISGRSMNLALAISYGLLTALHVFLYVLSLKEVFNPALDPNGSTRITLILYITETVFVLASTLLYLLIMISIKKLGHLTSAQLNKPQRYVLWQLVAVFIGKILLIPVAFVFNEHERGIPPLQHVDGVYTAITIQLTYLGCNRHNLMSLLSSLKLKNFFRIVFCPCSIQPRVEPEVVNQIETTGRNQVA